MKRPQQLSWAWWGGRGTLRAGAAGTGEGAHGAPLSCETALSPGLPGQALQVGADKAAGRTACGRECARPPLTARVVSDPTCCRPVQPGRLSEILSEGHRALMRQGLPPPCGPSRLQLRLQTLWASVEWWLPASGGPGRASGCDLLSHRLQRQQGQQDTQIRAKAPAPGHLCTI